MPTFRPRRSRRQNFPSTEGYPFVPWDGPDFMQQTNFTGTSSAQAQLTGPQSDANIGAPLKYLTMGLQPGDVVLIQIAMAFDNQGSNAPMNMGFRPDNGDPYTLTGGTVQSGDVGQLIVRLWTRIQSDGTMNRQTLEIMKNGFTSSNGYTITAFPDVNDYTLTEAPLWVDFASEDMTAFVYQYWTTRIRAGILP